MHTHTRSGIGGQQVLATTLLVGSLLASPFVPAQQGLEVAQYLADGQLSYPDNLVEWIHVGSSLGSDYNENAFDPAHPGTLGVVQMEPAAYRYFVEHGDYADGTMFLLSFYASEATSSPQLNGFVQGNRLTQEIHVIDRSRYVEGSAFFMFPSPGGNSRALPEGSECIQCHSAEGDFRATFIQFYPTIRELPRR